MKRLLCAALLAAAPAIAFAQAKPLRWIVPFPPGGVADITARILSQQLSPAIGQPIVIEHRTGAGGIIGAGAVAKGPPDGNMLLIAGQSVPTAPSLYKDLTFNPFKDLAPVVQIGATPNLLVVGASHPARTVRELVDMAKAQPGKLNYATVGRGSLQQLGGELFKRDSGIQVVQVPFKGGQDLVLAVVSGTVDFALDNMTTALSHLKSGKLRPLAIAMRERDPMFPDLPTMAEAGYPNVLVTTWQAVWTTAGTPPERVAQFERELRRILTQPDTIAQIQKTGLKVSNVPGKEFARMLEEEHALWDKVLKAAGIQPE